MRNTIEHPITTEEIIQCLRDLIDQMTLLPNGEEVSFGDMRPLLLQKAIDIILTGRFDPT